MNIKKLLPAFIFLFSFCLSFSQTVPGTLSYQGILMQNDGITPLPDVAHNIVFSFYNVSTGGSSLFSRNITVTPTKGLYTCVIGGVTGETSSGSNAALPASLGSQQIYIGLTVNGGTELTPRAQLTTTAYAFQAQSAYTISDGAVTNTKLATDAVDNTKLANDAVNTNELTNGAVTLAKLATDAVDNSKLTNDAINTAELVNGSVTNSKLATGIDASKLTAGVLPLSALPSSTLTGTGTSGNVPFWTGPTSFGNDAGLFWDNANKRMGLGLTNTAARLHILGSGSGTDDDLFLESVNSIGGVNSSSFRLRRSRGTIGTETALLLGDVMGRVAMSGNYGTSPPSYIDGSQILTITEGNFTSTANTQDAALTFNTALDGVLGERMRITSAGNVGIGTSIPGSTLDVNGGVKASAYQVNNSYFNDGSIELSRPTPFIDFHFNSSVADYTSRIIESSSGTLTAQSNFGVTGDITVDDITADVINASDISANDISSGPGLPGTAITGNNGGGTQTAIVGYKYGVFGIASGGSVNHGVGGSATGAGTVNYGIYGYAAGATTNYAGYLNDAGYFNGNVRIIGTPTANQTAFTLISDQRVKKNISQFEDGLSTILRINPVKFMYNGLGESSNDGQEHIGIIAQDMQKIAPYMISTEKRKLNPNDEFHTDMFVFNGSALNFILINSIKEQQTQIEELKNELIEIRKLLNKNNLEQVNSTGGTKKK